ncbi:MAG: hypothetical protein IJZ90_01965 [Clostridia bacterium]|nr:hypothetical protein [Clostridia bacterium]
MIATVDFHSHILPGVDDGSQSVEETICMLEMIKEQSCEEKHYIAATPHFKEDTVTEKVIDSFIRRRDDAYKKVKDVSKISNLSIILGAEVALNRSVAECPDLKKLCMGNSNILLIELPGLPYKPWMYEFIQKIRYEHGLIPMIAHFERYMGLYTQKDFEEIFDLPDAIFQFTSSNLTVRKLRKFILPVVRSELPVVMGTDCHNKDRRSPDYYKGLSILKKHLDDEEYEAFCTLSAKVVMEMI